VSDNQIVLVLATASTGFMAAYDVPAERAVRLAVRDVNEQGGVAGKKLKVLVRDTKSDQQTAATVASELISEGADVILASTDFDFGSPSAIAAQAQDRVTISLGAGSPKFGVQGIGPLAFTMADVTPTVASTGAEWAYRDRGWRNAAVLCDSSIEYSTALCDSFTEAWTQAGGKIVVQEEFQQSDPAISQQLTRLQTYEPDFVYLASYLPGAASAIRQLRSAGIDWPIVSGEAMDGQDWLATVKGLSDFYFPAYGYIYGPSGRQDSDTFVEGYKEEYGDLPPTSAALPGYATVEVLIEALKKTDGDTTGTVLAKALEELTDVPTIIGNTTFTAEEHFSLEREMEILEVQNGKIETLGQFKAEDVVPPKF